MEEWKEYKLGDVVRLINGRAYLQHELFDKGKYKIVRVGNLSGGDKWFYSDMELSEEKYCEDGDLLYAWACNFGPYIWKGCKTIYHYHIWKLIEDDDVVDKLFLFYYLKYLTPYWLGNVNGSVMVHITKGTMEKFLISLPSLAAQRRIATILKSLDDKIEVNRRINDNLEQQAQALFKSWFVDFEPFRDQPFVESELGMIPKGWRVVSLDEACTKITDGSHFSPKDNPCGTIPMLSVKDMHHNGFDYSSCKMIDEVEYLKMKKNDCIPLFNDILVAKDGSYLKEIFICKEEKKQAILSSIAIFRSNPKVIYPDLLLQLLRLPKIKKDVGDNYVSGSALPRIVLKDFKKFKFVVPPVDIQETTIDVYISINAQIEKNETESRRLSELRDTLLPRLMSGETKVE